MGSCKQLWMFLFKFVLELKHLERNKCVVLTQQNMQKILIRRVKTQGKHYRLSKVFYLAVKTVGCTSLQTVNASDAEHNV